MKIVKEERDIARLKVAELRIGQCFLDIESDQLCVVTEVSKNMGTMMALGLKTETFVRFFDDNDCVGAIEITEIKYKEV